MPYNAQAQFPQSPPRQHIILSGVHRVDDDLLPNVLHMVDDVVSRQCPGDAYGLRLGPIAEKLSFVPELLSAMISAPSVPSSHPLFQPPAQNGLQFSSFTAKAFLFSRIAQSTPRLSRHAGVRAPPALARLDIAEINGLRASDRNIFDGCKQTFAPVVSSSKAADSLPHLQSMTVNARDIGETAMPRMGIRITVRT